MKFNMKKFKKELSKSLSYDGSINELYLIGIFLSIMVIICSFLSAMSHLFDTDSINLFLCGFYGAMVLTLWLWGYSFASSLLTAFPKKPKKHKKILFEKVCANILGMVILLVPIILWFWIFIYYFLIV